MRPVLIVDYGLGNLFSVARAFKAAGAQPAISSDPRHIPEASLLVLPGVGAFGDGMKGLEERGLAGPIKDYASSGRPLLGICLGMQLLMSEGFEFGGRPGLGLIPGKVVQLQPKDGAGKPLKLPHVGWNKILRGQGEGKQYYFVHSFIPVPDQGEHVLAECRYGDTTFCAAIRRGAITGYQFHPEKSGPAGIQLLSRFIEGRDP